MKYRQMGNTGLRVSEISLGAWLTYGGSVEDTTAADCMRTAIEQGINFIDVADVYAGGQAELVVGQVIKDYTRSDLVISSKAYWPMSDNVNNRGLSRKHLHESVDKSLARLGTDYLDMYFCHRYDTTVQLEEVVRAMDDLVHAGKVLYWGTSVWDENNLNGAVETARRFNAYPPKVEQPRYNMLDRHIEPRIMPTCAEHGIGIVVWSPLAQGLLTGKYNDGLPADARGNEGGHAAGWVKEELTEANLPKVRALTELAKELGASMSQLALAWCLRNPEISSVITGASRPQQVLDNVKAADLTLDAATQARIEGILANTPT